MPPNAGSPANYAGQAADSGSVAELTGSSTDSISPNPHNTGSGVSGGGAGRLAGFLLQPPHMRALALGCSFGFYLVRLVCLGCHGIQFLIMSDFSPVGYDRGYIILQ